MSKLDFHIVLTDSGTVVGKIDAAMYIAVQFAEAERAEGPEGTLKCRFWQRDDLVGVTCEVEPEWDHMDDEDSPIVCVGFKVKEDGDHRLNH